MIPGALAEAGEPSELKRVATLREKESSSEREPLPWEFALCLPSYFSHLVGLSSCSL